MPNSSRYRRKVLNSHIQNYNFSIDQEKIQKKECSFLHSLLQTWWFCCEDWPPQDYDHETRLAAMKWKLISLYDWEKTPIKDENGNYILSSKINLI